MTPTRPHLRSYSAGDEEALVRLWCRCLHRDPVTRDVFRRKVLLDPNLERDGAIVAEADGLPVGFCLGIARRVPLGEVGVQPERGWITAFFVAPERRREGIGAELVRRAVEHLRGRGRTQVWVSPYAPHYFAPGVDVDAYPGGVRLLESLGFVADHFPVGMSRSLLDHEVPADVRAREAALAADGVRVRAFRYEDTLPLLEFLHARFPGDWPEMVRERVRRGADLDEILVAEADGRVVGYAHVEGERFGPFGVDPDAAGRGIGAVLFHRALERMREKGRRNLWLAWTHGAARRFYERNGLVVQRRHAVMKLVAEPAAEAAEPAAGPAAGPGPVSAA